MNFISKLFKSVIKLFKRKPTPDDIKFARVVSRTIQGL